jgi:hypothetical protein
MIDGNDLTENLKQPKNLSWKDKDMANEIKFNWNQKEIEILF